MGKGAETRRSILDKALPLASQIGLEALTIGHLAKETGLSKSGLYAHFESKEHLQVAILEHACARFEKKVIEPAVKYPRGEPRIRGFFDHWLRWDQDRDSPGGCPFINIANEFDDRPGAVRDRLVEAQGLWMGLLAKGAEAAQREGHFRADLDPHQFAYSLYAIILAYHHFHRLLRDPESEHRARQSFEALLESSKS